MGKKNKNNQNVEIKNEEVKQNKKLNSKKEKSEKEPMTKAEKIFSGIVVAIGVIAIIIVIIVIGGKGKTDPIRYEYDVLNEDHRVVKIDYNEFIDMVVGEKDFQLILGNKNLEDAKYYIYYANELCEQYDVETLYYLDSSTLDSKEEKYIKQDMQLTSAIFDAMNVIYFENGQVASQTFTGDLEEYGNCWDQLVDYFKECYGDE